MSDRTEPTVEVPVAELEDLRKWRATWRIPVLDALVARIPEPEWEPSYELIEVIAKAIANGSRMVDADRDEARRLLIAQHAAGFDLTRREDSDNE